MIRDLSKLPKRKVSVDDLLGFDNINDLIAWVNEEKPNILEAVVILSLDGQIAWKSTGLPLSRLIYLLKAVEHEELAK